jgi:hypothetical protein
MLLDKANEALGDALLQIASRSQVVGMPSLSDRSDVNTSEKKIMVSEAEEGQLGPPTGAVAITVQSLKCGQSIYAPDGACPAECPLWAQEGGRDRVCYFRCVAANQCGKLDPKEDIPDEDLGICRKCQVVGCEKCAKGQGDRCGQCDEGYKLNEDGSCTSEYFAVWGTIFTFAGIIGCFLICWLAHLQLAPVVNREGLKEGLAYRSSLKLRCPKSVAALVGADTTRCARPLWPVSTNLHAVKIAGAGLTLHMNFQLFVILWGCFLVVTWVIFTYFTSPDMLVLGLYPADTPQQLCSVTLRGKEVQHRLMSTKVIFMIIMLVSSMFFNFAYAVYQRRKFQKLDDGTSMMDFVAICKGLPELPGDQLVENQLKQFMEEATGEKVIGVSVCWNYKEYTDLVQEALDREVDKVDDKPALPSQAELDARRSTAQKVFGWVDALFGFTGKLPAPEVPSDEHATTVEDMLKSISSTDTAFIVFDTEAARDKAEQIFAEAGGVTFQDKTVTLTIEPCEPDTVLWGNFKVTQGEFLLKSIVGFLVILVALVVWACGFYLPFAVYQASFAKQGQEPPFVAGFVFSMLVVAGNQMMYFLCGTVAERVGFIFKDKQEAFYITFYTVACTLNLAVDMAMEFFLAYEAARAAGAHTADGQLLEDLQGYQLIFESYVMQKALGTRLFAYCFPATFFVPFLMEPVFAIFFPYHICKLLVRTHPEVRGREAEKSMNFFAPMDMARYGDLLLNMMLSVLIVFFPPGTFLKMMLALVVSHVYVYIYDQYRILRSVPSFDFASDFVDRLVQILMAAPSAFLAAGIVFKGSCLDGTGICVKGYALAVFMAMAAVVVVLFQVLVVKLVVPLFDRDARDHQLSEETYAKVAAQHPSTWFSENPVHCLRSTHIYKHGVPIPFNTPGKEHLMKSNSDLGVHFESSDRIDAHEYEDNENLKD